MIQQRSNKSIASGQFFEIFVQTAGKWRGCDWSTTFGLHALNLNGLVAGDAALIARATLGTEASDWRAAAKWLARVECQAKRAEAKAAQAAEVAEIGKLPEALRLAEEACGVERRYHVELVWQPLRDAIATALVGQPPNSHT